MKENRAAYTLFATELGLCGLVWQETNDPGRFAIVGFQLPESDSCAAESRIEKRWGAVKTLAVPAVIDAIIQRVKLHLQGEVQDFCDIELALEGIAPFTRQIYRSARAVPAGQTTTYGQLAAAAGHPGTAQAVGTAMRKNPIPLIIPCHRVLAAGNRPGGFSAHGGLKTKARLLELEGVRLPVAQQLDLGI